MIGLEKDVGDKWLLGRTLWNAKCLHFIKNNNDNNIENKHIETSRTYQIQKTNEYTHQKENIQTYRTSKNKLP